ncbi:hypothetical protein ABI118_15390, partial [Enterococcus faecium]|uniref:hypothetical protein n=1 Tax=Enterococcus faecium TaxID=1352 RepID=UPI003F43A641
AQADLFRIKRDYTPHLYGSVEQSKILREARPYTPMQATPEMAKQSALVQTSDYANPAIPTPTFSAAVAKKATGNYLWGQSASGGYYDASGQI